MNTPKCIHGCGNYLLPCTATPNGVHDARTAQAEIDALVFDCKSGAIEDVAALDECIAERTAGMGASDVAVVQAARPLMLAALATEVVTGFLLCKLPLTVICADCVRDHHDQHRPLMRTAGRPTVGLRCDECTRYFDVDFDFTYRLAR